MNSVSGKVIVAVRIMLERVDVMFSLTTKEWLCAKRIAGVGEGKAVDRIRRIPRHEQTRR